MPRLWPIAVAALVALTAATPAPPARFERIAVLSDAHGIIGSTESTWSPDGRWLAFQAPGALRLFDRRSPSAPPRTVLDLPVPTNYSVVWSRDSRWLAMSSTTYGGLNDNGPRIREALWVVRADSGEAVRLETDSDAYPVFWDAENFLYLRSSGDRFRRIRPAGVPAPSSAGGVSAKPEFWTLRYPGVRVYPGDPPGLGRLPTKVTNALHLPLPGGRRFLLLRNPTATEPEHYEVVDTLGVVIPGLGGPLYWDSAGTSIGGFLASAATPDERFLLGELISGDADEHGDSGGAARLWMVELAGWKGGPIAGAGEAAEPCLSPDGRFLAFARDREGRIELHIGRLVPSR